MTARDTNLAVYQGLQTTDVAIGGGGGGPPTGAAGGALAGTYPNPALADAELNALAGLTSAADKVPYFTGGGTAALATFTSTGRSAVASASAQALRAVAGTVWANLANVVTDFGADPTGATDSTTAFVNAAAAIGAGTYNGLFMPSGVFKITPGMVVFPTKTGFTVIGNGAPGDTNTAVTQGTYLKSDGTSGEPLLTFHGSNSVYCANFAIWGNSSASLTGTPCIGIRWENVASSGVGSGVSVFDMVRMFYCDYFWDNGHTGTGLDTNNAADFVFRRCDWSFANNGMVVRQDQNVNFQFDGGGMISVSGTAFNFIKGGNLTARNFFTSAVGTLLVPGSGGNNVYWHFFDCHFDSSTFLTLFDGSAGSGGYVLAEFNNCVCNTGQLTSGGTRCKVAANQTVIIRGGRELCGTNAVLFSQTGGVVIVDGTHISTDATKVRDPASSGGKYRVINCIDHTTGTFIAAYGDLDAAGDALTTDPLSQFAATTSAQLAGVISDETGSGFLVFATSPTLTTPVLGVATATSVNKVAITAPATGATLTIDDGFTLHATGNVTALSGSHTGTSSGTNTGDQTITLTGAVTGSGTGSITTTAADGRSVLLCSADQKVTNATNQDSLYIQFAVAAGGSYTVELNLATTNNDGNGVSIRLAVSSGTMTGKGNVLSTSTAGAASHSTIAAAAAANTGSISLGSASDDTIPYHCKVVYSFKASANATFKLQFGNVTATAGRNSSVLKNSVCYYIQHD